MRAKVVICELCDQTTKADEILDDHDRPFILGFQPNPKLEMRIVEDDIFGQTKHICLDCINAIIKYGVKE